MASPVPDVEAALRELPLFPLPEVVLFPGTLMPLHVFEPRYRAMIRSALDTHQALSVVQIADPDVTDADGQPSIARIAGIGVILHHQELSGGRYNILVKGVSRAELVELPFVPPYRRARATLIEPEDAAASPADLAALISTATSFATIVRSRDQTFDFRLPKSATPGMLTDLCAHHLLVDGRERQRVLETIDVPELMRLVATALASQTALLSDAPAPSN